MCDEDYMKNRLLFDGEGVGDDRRLNQLYKQICKFAKASDESPEDTQKSYDRLISTLNQCEWTDSKHKLVQAMNRGELQNYEVLYQGIEEGIVKTRDDIQKSKEELVEARKIRRNRMEYDALAKVICKNPDRSTTGQKLSDVRADLASLQKTEEALDEKLELRKKQFHVLVHTIHQLQSLLDAERKEEGGDEDAAAATGDQPGSVGGTTGDSNSLELNTSNVSSEAGGGGVGPKSNNGEQEDMEVAAPAETK